MVDLDPLDEQDELRINVLLKRHIQLTNSDLGRFILSDWTTQSAHFIKVFPKEYKAVLQKRAQTVQA